jgi:hypothetical protein
MFDYPVIRRHQGQIYMAANFMNNFTHIHFLKLSYEISKFVFDPLYNLVIVTVTVISNMSFNNLNL